MRALAVTIVALTLWSPAALAGESDEVPARDGAAQNLAPLQSREVIERLKTMRAQLLLEQEYNRILEARLERQEFEEKLGESSRSKTEKDKPRVVLPRSTVSAPPRLEESAEQLTVKAVTVAPFKEAIVVYKGRVYTVRPGDKLGAIEIRDVNESGVITTGAGKRSAVSLGQ